MNIFYTISSKWIKTQLTLGIIYTFFEDTLIEIVLLLIDLF